MCVQLIYVLYESAKCQSHRWFFGSPIAGGGVVMDFVVYVIFKKGK